MISAITCISDMNISMRGQLIIQSELSATHVLSAESVRGTVIQKQKSKNIWESFTTDDVVIMYSVNEHTSDDDLIEDNDDSNTSLMYASYVYHITVYGDDAYMTAKKVKARFLSEDVILALRKVGIHLQNISAIENGDEYINQTYWHRNDFDINVSVRFDYTKIINDDSYLATDMSITTSK